MLREKCWSCKTGKGGVSEESAVPAEGAAKELKRKVLVL